MVSSLERDGLATRDRRDPQDRRLVQVSLTDKGRQVIEQAFREQNELEKQWFEPFSDEERSTLENLLGRVTTSITRGPQTHNDTDRSQTQPAKEGQLK